MTMLLSVTYLISFFVLCATHFLGVKIYGKGIRIIHFLAFLLPIANMFLLPYSLLSLWLDIDNDRHVKYANKLFVCNHCGKYSRYYQMEITKLERKLKKGDESHCCPHCDEGYLNEARISNYAWLDYHSDCPKIKWSGKLKYMRTIREINELLKQMESFEALEKYTKETGRNAE